MHPVCISRKYSWSMIRELNSVSQPHLLAGLCAGVAVNKKAPFLLQYSDPAQSLVSLYQGDQGECIGKLR